MVMFGVCEVVDGELVGGFEVEVDVGEVLVVVGDVDEDGWCVDGVCDYGVFIVGGYVEYEDCVYEVVCGDLVYVFGCLFVGEE